MALNFKCPFSSFIAFLGLEEKNPGSQMSLGIHRRVTYLGICISSWAAEQVSQDRGGDSAV